MWRGGHTIAGPLDIFPTSPNNYIRQPACVCGSSDAPTAIADPRRSQSFFRWLAVLPSALLAVAGLLPVAAGPRCRQRDRMDVPMDWVSGSTSAWLQWSPLDWVSGSTSAWLVPSRVTAAVGCSASAVARVCTCVEGGTWSSVALRAPPSTTVQWSPAQLDAAVGCSASAVARVCTCVGAAFLSSGASRDLLRYGF